MRQITEAKVKLAQEDALKLKLDEARRRDGKLWIPKELLTELIVHNHFARLHRGLELETDGLWRSYSFDIRKDEPRELIKGIRSSCLHCHRRPKLIRRELGETFATEIPRKILHLDFLHINKFSHMLVILDNATLKTYLKICDAENTENVATALMEFLGNFQLEDQFLIVTDKPSYFASKLMKKFSEILHFTQNFAISYAPWSNGMVESQMKNILKHVKTIASEYRLYEKDWDKMLGLLIHGLNNFPIASRGGKTPNELFMGPGAAKDPKLVDEENMFFVTEKGLIAAKDFTKVNRSLDEIRKALEVSLQATYDLSKLRRAKQRQRYLDKIIPTQMQFTHLLWVNGF